MITHKHKYYKGRTLSSETECFSSFISMNCIKGFFFSLMIFCVKENVIFKLKIILKGKDNCKVFL